MRVFHANPRRPIADPALTSMPRRGPLGGLSGTLVLAAVIAWGVMSRSPLFGVTPACGPNSINVAKSTSHHTVTHSGPVALSTNAYTTRITGRLPTGPNVFDMTVNTLGAPPDDPAVQALIQQASQAMAAAAGHPVSFGDPTLLSSTTQTGISTSLSNVTGSTFSAASFSTVGPQDICIGDLGDLPGLPSAQPLPPCPSSATECSVGSGSIEIDTVEHTQTDMYTTLNMTGNLTTSHYEVVGQNCLADATTLCLSEGRFKVQAHWATPDGRSGDGQAISLTSDTGYFWFFSSSNVEMVIKVLNACGFNPNFWVFAGGLTNVQVDLTVTDTLTNTVKTYQNPQNTAFLPIQDTSAFPTCSAGFASLPPSIAEEKAAAPPPVEKNKPSAAIFPLPTPGAFPACTANATTLCLSGGRFKVQAHWATSDGGSGSGQAISLSGDTGYFWFFSSSNVEMIVKVLNACSFASRIWVFAGGLTNVQVDLTVTDTQTGTVNTYRNPQSTAFLPIQDTNAFATCP